MNMYVHASMSVCTFSYVYVCTLLHITCMQAYMCMHLCMYAYMYIGRHAWAYVGM